MANTVELVFGANQARTTSQVIQDLQVIAKNVEASGATKLKFSIDSTSLQSLQGQTNSFSSAASNSVSKYSKQLVQYYKDLDKQNTSFNQKNLNGIDYEIKQRETAAKQFSSQLKAQMQQEQAEGNLAESNAKKTASAIKSQTNAHLQYNNILNQAKDYYERYSSSIQKNAQLNAKWQEYLDNMQTAPATTYGNQTGARSAMSDLTRETREAGAQVETLRDRLSRLFGIHLSTAITMIGIHALVQGLIQVYQNVVALDTSFTQFRIVTQDTDETMQKFGSDAAKIAEQIGSSINDITDAATVFARLGFNTNESLDLSKFTTIYSKIADVDMSSAESNITSIAKAFHISADQMESALDKLTYVGNNFPVSASELGEGLQNAASALASSGNSFSQSLAILTAANTTVQDISKASTGVRTISARIRNSETELNDLGETLDTSYNTIAKYRAKLKALSGVDILEKDNQTFKSTYDILDQLQAKWKSLSDTSKASITTMLAGTRQTNVFASLMNEWGEAQKVMSSMGQSTGTLAKDQSIYMDSIQGKIGKASAAFQALSSNILSSEIVKGTFDAGSGILGFLNKIISTIGLIPTVGGIATIVTLLKSAGEPKVGSKNVPAAA